MKKISFLGLLLIVMFSFCIPSFAHSESNIDIQLESYQKIIDKLNSELGSKMYIREDNKIQVYKSFKNKTPEEIESLLREEYIQNEQNIKSSERKSSDYMRSPAIVNELPSTRSVSEDITQTCSISYNSEAYLDSTIFSLDQPELMFMKVLTDTELSGLAIIPVITLKLVTVIIL